MSIGRTPDAADLPRRRHRLPQPRAARAPPRRPLHRRPRLAQRHLREPQAGSSRTCSPTATRSRSANSSSATWSAERDGRCRPATRSAAAPPARRPAPASANGDSRPRKALTIGAVCKILRPGVRRHLDLEDPLPRGPEAAHAAAHARRLPPLQPGRRRAAAGDPADAARRVPAAAGDPPGARRRQDRRRPHGPARARAKRRALALDEPGASSISRAS